MKHCKVDDIEWSGDAPCWVCGRLGDTGVSSESAKTSIGVVSWTLGAGKQTFGGHAEIQSGALRAAPRSTTRL